MPPSAALPPDRERAVAIHATASGLVALTLFLIWAPTGGGFWPGWVWLPLAAGVGGHYAIAWSTLEADRGRRAVRLVGTLAVVLDAYLVLTWAFSGAGVFWPLFPAAATGFVWAVLALVVHRERLFPRDRQLAERVDELVRTRRGALDVQAAELRRIERDLHDGAQARLVALSIQLGRAEERLADQPEVAELVRRARAEATAAIGELRDLARGIAPPVLADRGLAAAVEALGVRAAVPVEVTATVDERPPPAIETAAYFVVAEALANVQKHAATTGARVAIDREEDRLVVTVSDDGPGGADAAGNGLTGLRHRAEAVDGTLTVTSRPGEGTTIRAELPCES